MRYVSQGRNLNRRHAVISTKIGIRSGPSQHFKSKIRKCILIQRKNRSTCHLALYKEQMLKAGSVMLLLMNSKRLPVSGSL